MYFELAAQLRKLEGGESVLDPMNVSGPSSVRAGGGGGGGGPAFRASERWADAQAMLKELQLEQYVEQFEEEEMTSSAPRPPRMHAHAHTHAHAACALSLG